MFWSAGCSLFGGLKASPVAWTWVNCNFWSEKCKNFSCIFFLQFLVIKSLDPDWIRIRIRIHFWNAGSVSWYNKSGSTALLTISCPRILCCVFACRTVYLSSVFDVIPLSIKKEMFRANAHTSKSFFLRLMLVNRLWSKYGFSKAADLDRCWFGAHNFAWP